MIIVSFKLLCLTMYPLGPLEIDMTIVSPKKAELDRKDQNDIAFEKEVAAFERMKPELLEKYPGQFVAIYQGNVAVHGANETDVFNCFLEKFGPVICYIEKVQPETPRRGSITSVWIKRR